VQRKLRLKGQSIGVKIFGASVITWLMTAGLGLYSLYLLEQAEKIVEQTYDKPLMATNFARAASLNFALMDKEILLRTAPGADTAASDARIETLSETFLADLGIAEERALADDEIAVISEIKVAFHEWNEVRRSDLPDKQARLTGLGTHIVDRFDVLIELIAGHSFVERRKAVWAIASFETSTTVATWGALMLSAVITFLLARRIIKPLSEAATVAERIADGELDAPIPPGSKDETGLLLQSMAVMQSSIRGMMEREKAQARSARTRLADAVQNAQEGMILVDAAGNIVVANKQIDDFFPNLIVAEGASSAELFQQINKQLVERTAPDVHTPTPSARGHGFEDGEYRLADGRWVRLSSSDTRDGGFFVFASDFTAVKEREAALREGKRLAEAANKAKSAFLATMSHELRTPLNAIIGFAEMMGEKIFGKLGHEKYEEYVASIRSSGQHLLDVINSVLDLARSERGDVPLNPEPVALDALLAECVAMIQPQCARAGLKLHYAPQAGDAVVPGDPPKLRQIVLNLLSNAVKFTEPGGTVTAVFRSDGDWAEIRIIDTGIGIAPQDIPTALAPFGQVDNRLARRYEGTGLGLPLAKSLTELHGGRLEISSEVGHGTTVSVILPVRAQTIAPDTEPATAA
jgi:signal transduction histidine kinase/HAMP domain-containing protein